MTFPISKKIQDGMNFVSWCKRLKVRRILAFLVPNNSKFT
jgi:hypothetical protein